MISLMQDEHREPQVGDVVETLESGTRYNVAQIDGERVDLRYKNGKHPCFVSREWFDKHCKLVTPAPTKADAADQISRDLFYGPGTAEAMWQGAKPNQVWRAASEVSHITTIAPHTNTRPLFTITDDSLDAARAEGAASERARILALLDELYPSQEFTRSIWRVEQNAKREHHAQIVAAIAAADDGVKGE